MIRAFVMFMPLFLFAFCSQAQNSSEPIPPADFKITAIAGGLAPWSTESKVEIDAQGHGIYYTISADDRANGEFKKINEFTVDRLSLKTIYGAVAKSDFFNLKEEYTDQGTLGGSFAAITVTLHGKTRTVRTQNIEGPAFDNINIAINLAVPEGNKIKYNAIL
jgi:hypothetical protein